MVAAQAQTKALAGHIETLRAEGAALAKERSYMAAERKRLQTLRAAVVYGPREKPCDKRRFPNGPVTSLVGGRSAAQTAKEVAVSNRKFKDQIEREMKTQQRAFARRERGYNQLVSAGLVTGTADQQPPPREPPSTQKSSLASEADASNSGDNGTRGPKRHRRRGQSRSDKGGRVCRVGVPLCPRPTTVHTTTSDDAVTRLDVVVGCGEDGGSGGNGELHAALLKRRQHVTTTSTTAQQPQSATTSLSKPKLRRRRRKVVATGWRPVQLTPNPESDGVKSERGWRIRRQHQPPQMLFALESIVLRPASDGDDTEQEDGGKRVNPLRPQRKMTPDEFADVCGRRSKALTIRLKGVDRRSGVAVGQHW